MKLHKITPDEIYRLALLIEQFRDKYGVERTAFILETTAKAIRDGKFGNGGKAREIFVG